MRSSPFGLLAFAALLAPSMARADVVTGTRSDKLVEQTHVASLRLDHGHAELVVRRTVHNGGPRHDQAMMSLEVPSDAVAVDLRTLSMKDGQPIWYRAELMEAEAAAAKYRELTGIGGYYPKDPALLSWRHPGLLALQVFPVPPGQPKTIEYTLELPTHYRGGRYHVTLPRMGTDRLAAQVAVSAVNDGERVFIGGRPAPPGSGIVLDREIDFSVAQRAPATLDGALASVPVQQGRVLSHLRVEAAPRLSETPRGAFVVVIIDASRSLSPADRSAGIAAARAALAHFQDAHVEVLTFDREVKHHLGSFVSGSRAMAELDALTVVPRNGSRFDDALAHADALFARLPARVPKRILAVTDLLTRSELTPDRAAALLKSGALLHVGVVREGEPQLDRDDESPWASGVGGWRGLVWSGTAGADELHAARMAQVYEEWARPVRIHALGLKVKGIPDGALDVPPSLAEGEGLEDLRLGASDVTEVAISGELWATPIHKELRPDDGEARVWSALAFGAPEILGALDEKEMMVLAQRGHAVSPVTSLLAIEPGVRPSTEGLDELGTIGHGGGTGIGQGFGSAHGTCPPGGQEAFLRDAIRRGLDACRGGGRAATVELESTRDEIVDVPHVVVHGSVDATIERCLRDAAWEIDLPRWFTSQWQSWTITI